MSPWRRVKWQQEAQKLPAQRVLRQSQGAAMVQLGLRRGQLLSRRPRVRRTASVTATTTMMMMMMMTTTTTKTTKTKTEMEWMGPST